MQVFPRSWDLKTRIEFMQRKIILHSIAYYEMNFTAVSDKKYDEWARQLVQMQNDYGDISDTQYGYAMKDFDGTTGFDLYYRLTPYDRYYLKNIVEHFSCRPIDGKKSNKSNEKSNKKGKLF